MKKLIFVYILMNVSLLAFPQAIHIFHDGEKMPDIIPNGGIERIYFAPKFWGSTEYQYVFVTKEDGEKRYDVVDSVKFNLPHVTAVRHSYDVPADGCRIQVITSSMAPKDATVSFIPPIDSNADVDYIGGNDGQRNGYEAMVRENYIFPNEYEEHTEKWYLQCGEMSDSILLHFTGIPVASNRYNEIGFSADEVHYTIDTNFPDSKFEINYQNTEDVDIYYNEDGKPVIHFPFNDTGEMKDVQSNLWINSYCNIYTLVKQAKPFMHTSEEHMAALREFCDATDFETWGKNTNWWSDAPLYEWDYGVNHDIMSNWTWLINDHVVSLHFEDGYKGVHGTVPASFEIILDDLLEAWDTPDALNLQDCALYGVIPYNIRHSKNWSRYGWEFLMQDPWYGGGFDMEDINLRMDDEEIMYADGTKSTAYEELAKHKLTMISVGEPTLGIGNLCLAYANKGFEYIYMQLKIGMGGPWKKP